MKKEVTTYVEYHLDDDTKVKIRDIIQLLTDIKAEAEQTSVGINIDNKFYTCKNIEEIVTFLNRITKQEKIQVKQPY